jgi:hypothetical protein
MVKKCLIAIAVVALLATTVQGVSLKKEGWPWTWTKEYESFDICTFDVILEVGHYVQIEDCDELELKLDQVNCESIGKDSDNFPCYGSIDEFDVEGPSCVTITARANFAAVFGASFSGSGVDIIGDWDLSWPDGNQITGGTDWEDLKLCMSAWDVALWDSGETTGTVKVGEITINVKPPTEYGSGP